MDNLEDDDKKSCAPVKSSAGDFESTPPDNTKYTILQVNGCRFNRAVNWTGPEPPTSCELFVKNIPRKFKGEDLWPLFERYGRVFNIRVLMDYNDYNRGYAYVKLATESQAQLSMELLNYYFVYPGYRLNIQRSTDKNRLFANYIPRDVAVDIVQQKFKEIFPEMRDFLLPTSSSQGARCRDGGEKELCLHRGFAFLEFSNHQEAVAAKKMVYTGVLEIWGAQVKISWARPQENGHGSDEVDCEYYPRLFVKPFLHGTRPKDFMDFVEAKIGLHRVVRFDLKKTIGVLKVLTVKDGQKIMQLLKGIEYEGNTLHMEW